MSSIDGILLKARNFVPLTPTEVARLLAISDSQEESLFEAAREVKEKVFGRRILLFVPLYISNECVNDCCYCAFRRSNDRLVRRSLSMEEIVEEVHHLQEEGHRRVLLVTSEKPHGGLACFLEEVVREIKRKTCIRSIQVNPPPLTVEDCQRLYRAGYGTEQVFQETYHWLTYQRMHPPGPKQNYHWRLSAMERAIRGGWNSLGMGILLGLFDYRYETFSLVAHIRYLEKKFGIGPRSISLPRLCPALGAPLQNAPSQVDDRTFLRLLAVVRLAVPYAELVLSTREPALLRDQALGVGVSQISAGSHTSPGGYSRPEWEDQASQFQISDRRSLAEVIQHLVSKGYFPSFSTIEDELCQLDLTQFRRLVLRGRIRQLVTVHAALSLKMYLGDHNMNGARL